jgi:hypothetical protein
MSDPETGFNRYMKYGLGAYHRAPIWELVFHDCIATTWYWGDSTDYLYQAAPETIERKVAFNVLYGTMPMYWIQTLWEKERDRFLATYFPASKMHEPSACTKCSSMNSSATTVASKRRRLQTGRQPWSISMTSRAPWISKGVATSWRPVDYRFRSDVADEPSGLWKWREDDDQC